MPNREDIQALNDQDAARKRSERASGGRPGWTEYGIVGPTDGLAEERLASLIYGGTPRSLNASALSISDRPITEPSQDTLARVKFAELVAKSILQQRELDSLVIGLVGAWGSGKTSLLNLIEYYLVSDARKTGARDGKPIVVRFNPWLFADQSQLSRRFFREISMALTRDADSMARRAGRRMDVNSMLNLAELIDSYASIIEPFKFFGPPGEAVVRSARSLADLFSKRVKRATDDLQTFKEHINKTLHDLERRIVVMIDDIDRLSAAEIIQVFQLARLMGDFANTTYILSFDRRMVADILQSIQQNKGNEYLEKIVQITLDVPAISRAAIRNAALAEIGKVVGISSTNTDATKRYACLFDFAALYFLKTPRNVAKLATTYHFHRVLLADDRDVVDLLGVTMLQVFAPDLYETVRDRPELFLLSGDAGSSAERPPTDIYQRDLERLLTGAGVEAPLSELERFLGVMFPRVMAAAEGRACTPEEIADVEGRRGIGHVRFAQEYFDFTLPEKEYSERHWDALRRKLAGRDERSAIIDAAEVLQNQMSRVDPVSFLDRVKRFQASTPHGEAERALAKRLARVLLVEGDELVFRIEEKDERERELIERRIVELIEALLLDYGDENNRHCVLQSAYNYGHPDHVRFRGIGIPVLFLQRLRFERGRRTALYAQRFAQAANLHVIGGDDAFEDVESHAETLVERWLRDSENVDSHFLPDVLAALCDMNHKRAAVQYLNSALADDYESVLLAVAAAQDRFEDERAALWELLLTLRGSPPDGVSFAAITAKGHADGRIERVRVEMIKKLL